MHMLLLSIIHSSRWSLPEIMKLYTLVYNVLKKDFFLQEERNHWNREIGRLGLSM